MPRHEFFATGSGAAMLEGTSISSPKAANVIDKIVSFFADIKTQIPFLMSS
jgi:hypothetical protein